MKKLVLALALFFTPLFAEVTWDEVKSQIPGKVMILPPDAQPNLTNLNKTFVWMGTVGLNQDKVTLADFDFVAVLVFSTAAPGVHQYTQIHVIFKSLKSGGLEPHSLMYMDKFGTYPTAVSLMNLTKKKSE
jgi:hypothetical protein